MKWWILMELKTMWQYVNLFIASNFTFCHNILSKIVCCRRVRKRLFVDKVFLSNISVLFRLFDIIIKCTSESFIYNLCIHVFVSNVNDRILLFVYTFFFCDNKEWQQPLIRLNSLNMCVWLFKQYWNLKSKVKTL